VTIDLDITDDVKARAGVSPQGHLDPRRVLRARVLRAPDAVTPPGETDLGRLIRSMRPALRDGSYMFAKLPGGHRIPSEAQPLLLFEEPEGTTLIIAEARVQGLGLQPPFPAA
jgi:hypothetical protein